MFEFVAQNILEKMCLLFVVQSTTSVTTIAKLAFLVESWKDLAKLHLMWFDSSTTSTSLVHVLSVPAAHWKGQKLLKQKKNRFVQIGVNMQ